MSLSFYEIAVPTFRQGLTGLNFVLAKAETHFAEQGRDLAELMNDRISEDMMPFAFQIAQSVSHSQGALERLSGKGNLVATPFATFAEARQAVKGALSAIEGYVEADLSGAETRQIVWSPLPHIVRNFDGAKPYLMGFAIPNFYFHASTAYALARKNGVPIGKRDFMGQGDAPANA